jgi:hypothetical protein
MTVPGPIGPAISSLGIGTWATGGGNFESGWGPRDNDTAPAYGLGRAGARPYEDTTYRTDALS